MLDGTDRVVGDRSNSDLPLEYWDATGLPAGHPEAEQKFNWICIPGVIAQWQLITNPNQQYDLWR